ncbi:hypothetical protein, partial [Bilophila wadsworthia]
FIASSGKLLGKFGGYQLLEAVLRNRKQRQASKKVRRLYYRRFFGAAFFHVQGTAQRCNHFSFYILLKNSKRNQNPF